MSHTLLGLVEEFLTCFSDDIRATTGEDDSIEEIVLSPRAYRELERECLALCESYGRRSRRYGKDGFPELKIHNGAGYTKIRPHIPELDDYR